MCRPSHLLLFLWWVMLATTPVPPGLTLTTLPGQSGILQSGLGPTECEHSTGLLLQTQLSSCPGRWVSWKPKVCIHMQASCTVQAMDGVQLWEGSSNTLSALSWYPNTSLQHQSIHELHGVADVPGGGGGGAAARWRAAVTCMESCTLCGALAWQSGHQWSWPAAVMREAWPNEGLCLEMGQRAHDRSWLAVRMVPFFCLASRVVSGTLPISST